MGTALVLTVGTTPEPLVKAIEEVRGTEPDLVVFLLYGRPFAGQQPSPFDVAREVRERAAALGVRAEVREAADPEDYDVCLSAARVLLQEAAGMDRLVVNFTGGTKPLSAALVHAALTEPFAGELVLDYTGGEVRDPTGRVVKEAMRIRRSARTATDELLRRVLDLVRRSAYREARALTGRLPERGRAGFVRRAVEALYAWDEFDYESAVESLRRLYEAARALTDAPDVGPLAELVGRLVEPGGRLVEEVRTLRQLQSGSANRWPSPEGMVLLVADVLENALRRLEEGRPTDCVLRAYRAVEAAVQARLVAERVNPWRPDWSRLEASLLTSYLQSLSRSAPPQDLALTTGLRLVELLGTPLPPELARWLQDLQATRNHCYLEHGYRRVGEEDARRLVGYAETLCTHLLKADLGPARGRVTHRIGV